MLEDTDRYTTSRSIAQVNEPFNQARETHGYVYGGEYPHEDGSVKDDLTV